MELEMAEQHVTRVHTENVVLDIGEGAGSLIVYVGKELLGQEVEIAPRNDLSAKTHTDVAERIVNGATIFTAVFPPLPVGDYNVCRPTDRAGEELSVSSGRVTELDWR